MEITLFAIKSNIFSDSELTVEYFCGKFQQFHFELNLFKVTN